MRNLKVLKSPFFQSYGLWHCGEGFQTILFTWYMTFAVGLSGSEIGFFQALVLSPYLIFIILGGVVTDRYGAFKSFSIATGVFAIILIAYALLISMEEYSSVMFAGYCIAAGLVSAISNPAIDTFIPDATDQKAEKNSLFAATAHNIAKLSGTILGFLLPIITAIGGFILNGILMLASIVFLYKHNVKNPQKTYKKEKLACKQHEPAQKIIGTIVSHYKECVTNLDIVLSSSLLGLIPVPVGFVIWPLIIRERFPEHGDSIALIYITFWIGMIASTLITQYLIHKIRWGGRIALLLWLLLSMAMFSLYFAHSFAVLCFITFVTGILLGSGKPLVYGTYLENSPIEDRALFISIDQMAYWGLATIGSILLGALIDNWSLNFAIMLSSISFLVGIIILIIKGNLSLIEFKFEPVST